MSRALCLWVLVLLGRITPLEEIRFTSVFEQRYDYSCGIASISSLASLFWGFETSEEDLFDLLPGADESARRENITLHDLLIILESLGFTAGGFELRYDQLLEAVSAYGPLVVHLAEGEGHFALFLGETGGFVVLADPSRGCLASSRDEFLDSWTRVALAVFHPDRVLDMNVAARGMRSAGGRIAALQFWSMQ